MRSVLIGLMVVLTCGCEYRHHDPVSDADAGRVLVYSAPTKAVVASGQETELDATCEIGDSMVAGGCAVSDPSTTLAASFPLILAGGNADAWRCRAYNGGSEDQYLMAHIVCRSPGVR